MKFSRQMIDRAWKRSEGFCECDHGSHIHEGRCNRVLFKFLRGKMDSDWGWEVHSKTGRYNRLSDSEILCSRCYLVHVLQESTDAAGPVGRKKSKLAR